MSEFTTVVGLLLFDPYLMEATADQRATFLERLGSGLSLSAWLFGECLDPSEQLSRNFSHAPFVVPLIEVPLIELGICRTRTSLGEPTVMAGSNLFTGTLDLLMLHTLRWGPKHGYGIGKWIHERTDGAVDLDEGALYSALHRLEKKGFIEGSWGETDTGRRARFYSLKRKGANALKKEAARWEAHAGAVFAVLNYSGE